MDLSDFEFLSWLSLTGLFPGDLRKELLDLGVDSGLVFLIVHSEAVKRGDIIALYRNYGRVVESDSFDWFMTWIKHNRQRYDTLTTR